MPILLVRHARAGNRSKWQGDDRVRPLTRKGARQGEALVPVLEPFGPGRILSSPFMRCVQTMEPLAKACGLPVEEVEALEEGRIDEAVAVISGLLSEGDGAGAVVACTHGDVVLAALRALAPGLPSRPPMAKGSVWVLGASGDGHDDGAARYLPAPP